MQPPWAYNRFLKVRDPQPRRRMLDNTTSSENSSGISLTKKQEKALEKSKACNSEPWNKPSLNDIQMRDLQRGASSSMPWNKPSTGKPDLKGMQTFTECLQLISELAEEVKDIGQLTLGRRRAVPAEGAAESGCLDKSRSLILQWARELDQINMLKKPSKPTDEEMRRKRDPGGGGGGGGGKERNLDKESERLQQWAIELKNVKEANGLSDEDLKRLLGAGGKRESRLARILPLLEFVAWSLLSHDTEEDVSKLWLPNKQKAWRTGTWSPKYIPNSVWQWVQSASVRVRLDPSTSHPWLAISADQLQVQEAEAQVFHSADSARRFNGWPCVLGDAVITAGRHYWEVEVSCSGTWRLGVTSISAPRKQKVPMSPKAGYWTLWKGSQGLWVCTDNPAKLPGAAPPRVVGVYVDVEEGQVSFYDVEHRAHIYTFSDSFRGSLVPVFACLDGNTVLRILPLEI